MFNNLPLSALQLGWTGRICTIRQFPSMSELPGKLSSLSAWMLLKESGFSPCGSVMMNSGIAIKCLGN